MTFDVPDDRKYLASHEWALVEGETARIGITDFAQDELGDVVFVELPGEGDEVRQEAPFGVVESIKAVSDLYAPLTGTVVDVNDELEGAPELVNDDPFGDGWLIEVELTDPDELDDLLTADEYREQTE